METTEKSVDVGEVHQQPPEQDQLSKHKYVRTALLIFAWISLGLYSEILGPTLPTLMKLSQSNYQGIGSALAVREIGLFSGSLLGGYLADIWRSSRALLLASALTVGASTNLLVPWCRSLAGLSTVLYVAGCAHGFLTTNGNPLLSTTWGAKAAGPFSLMHAGYGIGAAISPAFLAPFTTKEITGSASGEEVTTIDTQGAATAGNSSSKVVEYVEPVVPYGIVAGVLLVCALGFFLIGAHDVKPVWVKRFKSSGKREVAVVQDDSSVRSRARSPRIPSLLTWFTNRVRLLLSHLNRHLIFVVVLTFSIYFSIVCNERVFGKFIYSYATKGPTDLSADDAYLLQISYWLVFTASRLLIFLLALRISPRILFALLITGTLLSSIVFAVVPHTRTSIFIATAFFSLAKGPLFPAALGVINLSWEISGRLVLVVNVGSACGGSLSQFIAGVMIQRYGQVVFPHIIIATACILLLVGVVLILYLRRIGNRFQAVSEEYNQAEVETFKVTSLSDLPVRS